MAKSENLAKRSYYFEKFIPVILAFVVTLGFSFSKYNLLTNSNFQEVLRSTISVSAVLVGFMATMVAVLISNINSKTISLIKENDAMELLNSYFHSALLSGLVLAIGSTACIITRNMTGPGAVFISDVWVAVSSFFVFASFRVIIIMLSILKSISTEKEDASVDKVVEPEENKAFQQRGLNT